MIRSSFTAEDRLKFLSRKQWFQGQRISPAVNLLPVSWASSQCILLRQHYYCISLVAGDTKAQRVGHILSKVQVTQIRVVESHRSPCSCFAQGHMVGFNSPSYEEATLLICERDAVTHICLLLIQVRGKMLVLFFQVRSSRAHTHSYYRFESTISQLSWHQELFVFWDLSWRKFFQTMRKRERSKMTKVCSFIGYKPQYIY